MSTGEGKAATELLVAIEAGTCIVYPRHMVQLWKSTGEGTRVNKIRKGGLWNLVSETSGEVFGGTAGNEDLRW